MQPTPPRFPARSARCPRAYRRHAPRDPRLHRGPAPRLGQRHLRGEAARALRLLVDRVEINPDADSGTPDGVIPLAQDSTGLRLKEARVLGYEEQPTGAPTLNLCRRMLNRRPRLFNLAPPWRRQHSRGRLCHMDLALHRPVTVMHETL